MDWFQIGKRVRQGCLLSPCLSTLHAEFSSVQFSSTQLLSCVWLFVTPWTAAHKASLSITISKSFLKFMSIKSVMPFNHLILSHPLLLLPSIFPSIRVFSNESVLSIRWPKYWSFSFSNSPSNEYSGLISFRIDWFDCLAVQGTLKSLLQHHIVYMIQHHITVYAEYMVWNARLDEAQAGIKIARRKSNNLRYADDTTLMAESKELKSLLMKLKKLA